MAQAIILQGEQIALDPEHVESMDLWHKEIRLTSGKTIKLSEADFETVYRAKTGAK